MSQSGVLVCEATLLKYFEEPVLRDMSYVLTFGMGLLCNRASLKHEHELKSAISIMDRSGGEDCSDQGCGAS